MKKLLLILLIFVGCDTVQVNQDDIHPIGIYEDKDIDDIEIGEWVWFDPDICCIYYPSD